MDRLAFATYDGLPALDPDDRLAVAPLAFHGFEVVPAVWNDPHVVWTDFRAVVLRSCWDYHHCPDDFRAWIPALRDTGVRVLNPPGVVLWNLDKVYLRALAEGGIRVVETVWLPQGQAASLPDVLARHGWDQAVVKPSVSMSAYATWLTSPVSAAQDQQQLDRMLHQGDVMVQRFLSEIQSGGEWSLVFFNGAYSHTALKTPAEGDFRVQTELGGRMQAVPPPAWLIDTAQRILRAVDEPCLYARVDGVVEDGAFVLMELEVIDPSLYLGGAPGAAERFAQAIHAVL